MRIMLFVIIVAMCGMAWSEDAALKIMSFNVRCSVANDGPDSWEYRKEILAETLRQYAPDIVGTQECFKNQADFIAQSCPEYLWFGVGREADGGGEMMAVFYRPTLLTPLESGHFWLSETPEIPGSRSWETNCTRMVTWARFRHLKTGAIFYYMNTHFDHRSEQARIHSAKLICERLKSVDPKIPVVVGGDFNVPGETSEPWRVLAQGGFQDAWLTAAKKSGPVFTFTAFKPAEVEHKERIDWLMFRGPVKVSEIETVSYNKDGRYPSDHYPVQALFTLPGEAPSK